MEALYSAEVTFLVWLQNLPVFGTPHWQNFWLLFTKLGDPSWLLWVYLPIISAFLPQLSIPFLLTAMITEFFNSVFKWILQGDRPYWWIHESGYYGEQLPALKQYSLTCETGPGSPSGHAMTSGSAWFIVVIWIFGRFQKRAWVKNLSLGLYVLFLKLVAISRLYIGTHFVHQVLLGAAVGVLIGWSVWKFSQSVKLNLTKCCHIVAVLTLIGLVTVYSLKFAGIDTNASISLAYKWCKDASWISLSTTPLSSCYRDAGAIIGLGVALESQMYKFSQFNSGRGGNLLRRVITALIGLGMVQLVGLVPLPARCMIGVYSVVFVKSAVASFLSVAFVPYLVERLSHKVKNG